MGEHPGGLPWCWARLEGHVAEHQISGPAGLGGVLLSKRYPEVLPVWAS